VILISFSYCLLSNNMACIVFMMLKQLCGNLTKRDEGNKTHMNLQPNKKWNDYILFRLLNQTKNRTTLFFLLNMEQSYSVHAI
jgi:hypothetical protein